MTWLTPEWPINMAVTTLVKDDGVLGPMLKGRKLYDSVTTNVARQLPHLVLPTDAATLGNTFGAKGRNVFSMIHIVGTNREECEVIYNELIRLLDGTRLTLADHTMVRGSLTSPLGVDEENSSGYRKLCEYAVHALQVTP